MVFELEPNTLYFTLDETRLELTESWTPESGRWRS